MNSNKVYTTDSIPRGRSKSIGEIKTSKSKNYPSKMDSKLKKIFPLTDKQVWYVSDAESALVAWKMIVEKEHLCIAVSDANQSPVGLIDMLDFCAFFNSEQVYHLDELAKKKTSELMNYSKLNPLIMLDYDSTTFRDICSTLAKPNVRRILVVKNKKSTRFVAQSCIIRFITEEVDSWGDQLDKRIDTVEGILTTGLISIIEDQTFKEITALFVGKSVSGLPVVSKDGKLIGCISVRNIQKVITGLILTDLDITAKEFLEKFNMLTKPHLDAITCKCNDTVVTVIFKMKHSKHYRVFMVNDEGQPVGVISLKEIMNYLSRIDIARDQKIAADRKKELVKVFYSYKPLIKEVKPIVDKTGHSDGLLPYPITNKRIYKLGTETLKVGMACMQGWRNNMEDAHVACLSLKNHDASLFAIFDGHGGPKTALYMSEHILEKFESLPDIFDEKAVSNLCLEIDRQYLDACTDKKELIGTTAIISIIKFVEEKGKYRLLNVNIGDSRIVLGEKQQKGYTAIELSSDHKPNSLETQRIICAGGFVANNRVDSMLSVSRALGDAYFKTSPKGELHHKVIALPTFVEYWATKNDFLILSCDGIYEATTIPLAFTRQGLVNWIGKRLDATDDPGIVCGLLLNECLTRGSQDNMSVIIIQFKNGQDYHSDGFKFIPGPLFQAYQSKDSLSAKPIGATQFSPLTTKRKLTESEIQRYHTAYSEDSLSSGHTIEDATEKRKQLHALFK
jgi:protein phosphatase 2C family protein 2/3